MKFIIFFLIILIGGMLLIKENAFVQGSMAVVWGFTLVFSSVVGLSYSIAYPIKERYALNENRGNWVVIGLIGLLIYILSLFYRYFFEYEEKKLNELGKQTIGQVDSLAYERRGKLAPGNYFYYSYKVGEQTFNYSKRNNSSFESFQKLIIKYNPENPTNHIILKEKIE